MEFCRWDLLKYECSLNRFKILNLDDILEGGYERVRNHVKSSKNVKLHDIFFFKLSSKKFDDLLTIQFIYKKVPDFISKNLSAVHNYTHPTIFHSLFFNSYRTFFDCPTS